MHFRYAILLVIATIVLVVPTTNALNCTKCYEAKGQIADKVLDFGHEYDMPCDKAATKACGVSKNVCITMNCKFKVTNAAGEKGSGKATYKTCGVKEDEVHSHDHDHEDDHDHDHDDDRNDHNHDDDHHHDHDDKNEAVQRYRDMKRCKDIENHVTKDASKLSMTASDFSGCKYQRICESDNCNSDNSGTMIFRVSLVLNLMIGVLFYELF